MPIDVSPPVADVPSLGHAIVLSSHAPLLLLNGALDVIAGSVSFCQHFQVSPDALTGRPLTSLGDGEWNNRRLIGLLEATVSGAADVKAYEMDLTRKEKPARRLIVNAQRLQYDENDGVRVLLSISDVTDARLAEKLKADLVREKDILVQEVQHRVANSLQIIASILLQSARKMQSLEGRSHLELAHQRIMSIASLQQQLATGNSEDVALRPYFTQLCKSLGASMILDPTEISIEVNVDDTDVRANISISLGLIVTELVINALKHAFPDHRSGKIIVDYQSELNAWVLSIRDDGVGYPEVEQRVKPGLGTGIVEALATQLEAEFVHEDANPGTKVSIIHR